MRYQLSITRESIIAAILGLIVTVLPQTGSAAMAGRVNFVMGNVTITDQSGLQKAARKGAGIESGDTISTTRGRAQLKFRDGTYMSLQPDTEFKVDDYQFTGEQNGTERGFFSLLKGGLRTLTGLVGRGNRESFRVKTPVATIGIRGTEFLLQMGPTLLVSVGDGAVLLSNDAGELVLQAGQSGQVLGQDSAPQTSTQGPQLGPQAASPGTGTGGDEEPAYSSAEDTNASGEASSLVGQSAGTAVSGMPVIAYGVSSADGNGSLAYHDILDFSGNTLAAFGGQFMPGSATAQEGGSSNYLAWSRWSNGDVQVNGASYNLSPPQSLHYLVGFITPAVDMPTMGTATYTLVGATAPTLTSGATAGSVNSASLTADFAAGSVSANIDFSVGGNDFTISDMGLNIVAHTFSGSAPNAAMVINGNNNRLDSAADLRGFFAGPNAGEAGLIYSVENPFGTTAEYAHGAIGFEQGPVP